MRWPFMLRSTHERTLKELNTYWHKMNLDAWGEWCKQVKETRAAQKGLRRLQKKIKRGAASLPTVEGDGNE